MHGYCPVCAQLVETVLDPEDGAYVARLHRNRDGEHCDGWLRVVVAHPVDQPLRGIVRPALGRLGQAVTVVLSTIGQIRDSWRPPVDDSCPCRRHRRPHRTSTPRAGL